METWGWILLVFGAVVIGLVAQYLIRRGVGYEWVLVAVGAGAGGYVASEYELVGLGKWGTEYAGMYIYPAAIGAIVVGAVVAFVVYFGEHITAES
ncbi:MAG: hypothetical protein WBW04_22035 [Nitrolancea sp.]